MEIYLDNSATTKVYDEVAELMLKVFKEDYGNPSSMHNKGMEAERYVKKSAEIIAKILKVNEKEILFTSGGTESNNLAVIGTAQARKREGNHIVTTKIEHPSIANPMKYLEENGYEVTYLSVDKNGIIDVEELKSAIRKDTILVSIMHVNNEVGSIQPIDEVAKIIEDEFKNNSDRREKITFHVDAIQSFGKFEIYPKRMGIDLLSVSGHKINGPKGIGFLYIKDKVKISPLILGGGQQRGMRSGTENVPGIAGIGMASDITYKNLNEIKERMMNIKDYFIDELCKLDNVAVNSQKGENGAPHIISATFKGIRSEVLLHSLEDKGIYISAGSACSSNKPALSETLKAMNIPKEDIESTVRFSLGHSNTKEEIDITIKEINGIIELLRKYKRY